jgi:hypothetical protein
MHDSGYVIITYKFGIYLKKRENRTEMCLRIYFHNIFFNRFFLLPFWLIAQQSRCTHNSRRVVGIAGRPSLRVQAFSSIQTHIIIYQ